MAELCRPQTCLQVIQPLLILIRILTFRAKLRLNSLVLTHIGMIVKKSDVNQQDEKSLPMPIVVLQWLTCIWVQNVHW